MDEMSVRQIAKTAHRFISAGGFLCQGIYDMALASVLRTLSLSRPARHWKIVSKSFQATQMRLSKETI